VVDAGSFAVPVPADRAKGYDSYIGKSVVFGIRPEDIYNPAFVPPGIHAAPVETKVDVTELMGNEIFLYLVTGENQVVARVDPRTDFKIGDKAQVAFNMDKCHLFDPETEKAVR
jgi:multiple sugar transport system ATP-binding protein